MPKLYANTVYMVLNLRIHIMGGWDTYTASTDISFATDMNITSQSTRGTESMDGMQGQVSVVAITKVESSDDYEMGWMSVSHSDSYLSLKLIFPKDKPQDESYFA